MTTPATGARRVPSWLVPAGLVVLSLIPSLAGASRLTELALGAPVTHDNARFHSMPVPVVVHIIGAMLFTLLGAFQFAPRFRAKQPAWHRVAGRVAWAGGLAAAVTGVWMTMTYPLHDFQLQGGLLFVVRWLVGIGMTVSLVLAYVTVLQRKLSAHRAWMLRAYALGQGAGTQALVMLPVYLVLGTFGETLYDILMTTSWVINLAVAEWAIRQKK